ncbi:MAG: 30S ribosomal protein S16 [Bacteroidia bacterium]
MSVKIRLQRFGRKRNAFYHIVVADARAPRDGKSIERIGSYNPNNNPATIDINVDKAVTWLENGAQPSDTCRAILSYKGVLYKHHLNRGVAKGALTAEQAEAKFTKWLEEKDSRIQEKIGKLSGKDADAAQARLKAERKVSEERAARIAAKNTPVAEDVSAEASAEAEAEVEATEEAPETEAAAAVVAEEMVAEAAEPVAEVEAPAVEEVAAEETPAVDETPIAEATSEEPAAETEETPEA